MPNSEGYKWSRSGNRNQLWDLTLEGKLLATVGQDGQYIQFHVTALHADALSIIMNKVTRITEKPSYKELYDFAMQCAGEDWRGNCPGHVVAAQRLFCNRPRNRQAV